MGGRIPSRLVRLAGGEVDPARPELCDFFAGARSTFEDVLLPDQFKILESGGHDRGLKLCFQQSTSYSVGP